MAQGRARRSFDARRAAASFSGVSENDASLDESVLVDSKPVVQAVDEPKDLGFGSIVGGANERRLIERDGRFTSRREGFPTLSYLNGYHALLTMTWPKFLGCVTLAYIAVNALFALLFIACGQDALAGLPARSMGGVHANFRRSVQQGSQKSRPPKKSCPTTRSAMRSAPAPRAR